MDDELEGKALESLLRETMWLDALQRTLDRVNVLDVFRISRYELAHSAFWAWLLDPRGTHRMGDRFLRSFLRLCSTSSPEDNSYSPLWPTPKLMELELADLEHAEVSVEEQPRWMEGEGEDGEAIAKNRFDLMVRLALGKGEAPSVAVVVEFKIEAKEGKDQTDRYAKALSALLDDGNSSFKKALGVFVDFSRNRPSNAGFLPLTLADLVTEVILPVLKTGSDILHPDVSSLLGQYCQSVEEESDEVAPETARFIKEHRLALGLLRAFLRWSPSFDDLVLTGQIPEGSTITFKDTKTAVPIPGRVRVCDDRAAIILKPDGEAKTKEYFSVSRAAAAAGRRSSYNGWVHWYYQVSVHKPWFSRRQRPERGEGMVMYEPSWTSGWKSGRHGWQIIA